MKYHMKLKTTPADPLHFLSSVEVPHTLFSWESYGMSAMLFHIISGIYTSQQSVLCYEEKIGIRCVACLTGDWIRMVSGDGH